MEKKVDMKQELADCLYQLMLKESFEKITVQQLCDEMNVTRATFYYHYIDKFDALQYLMRTLFRKEAEEMNIEAYEDKLKLLISTIYQHQRFFYSGFYFEIEAQFSKLVHRHLQAFILEWLEQKRKDNTENELFDNEFLSLYYSNSLQQAIKYWVLYGCKETPDVFLARYQMLSSKGLEYYLDSSI